MTADESHDARRTPEAHEAHEALRQRVAQLEHELRDADERAAANGARVAVLAGLLEPFAYAYGRALDRCPSLAEWNDGDHWILMTPKVGDWRAAHAALNPPDGEPTKPEDRP